MTCEEAKKIVKPRLSEKRWTHTKNVKKMAVKLAKQWGADPEKAAVPKKCPKRSCCRFLPIML